MTKQEAGLSEIKVYKTDAELDFLLFGIVSDGEAGLLCFVLLHLLDVFGLLVFDHK